MRTRSLNMVAALLLIPAGAAAQEATDGQGRGPAGRAESRRPPRRSRTFRSVNQIDFGVRGTVFGAGSDQARFQRYRDLRDGGDARPAPDRSRTPNTYRYSLQADNVGYRDQRFSASYTNFGKVKASFEWNQIPLFYSQTTSTLYDQSTPGHADA